MFDLGKQTSVGTEYAIYLHRDDGTRIAKLTDVEQFSYTRSLNGIGSLSIALPHTFDPDLIKRNYRINIWRKPLGGSFSVDFSGLLKRHYRRRVNSVVVRTIGGRSLNILLQQRIIAYPFGGQYAAYSAKSDQADDMMKAIVRENLGTLVVNTARSLSSTYFSVAADDGAGPSLRRAFSNNNVLRTLQELSEAARIAGTEVYFDIVYVSETQFEFRTYIGQQGRDRTSDASAPLILRDEQLIDPDYDENYQDEYNVVYAGGQGEGDRRLLLSLSSSTATQDAFARSELFYDGRNEVTQTALQDRARAELLANRAVKLFRARIGNVPGARYGLDYGFGDRLTASFDGLQFDCLIRTVSVGVSGDGVETIDAGLEALV